MINIYVKTLDGKPIFATHTVKVNTLDNQQLDIPFQVESNNTIICYSDSELNKIQVWLKNESHTYAVSEVSWDDKIKEKVKDFKYNSRSELIKHIQDEIEEPEQNKLPRLIKENKELKVKLKDAEDKLKDTEDALVDVMMGRRNLKFIDRKFQEGRISLEERDVLIGGNNRVIK